MRRPYRRREAERAVSAAAAVAPQFGLGADVIVGFPGETEADFAATCALVDQQPFTYLHVFRFSPRPGTPAAGMAPVHPETVSERAARLRDLARGKREAFLAALVGQTREAVVEDRDERDPARRLATTDNYASVAIDTALPAGSLVDVAITGRKGGALTASVSREVPA